MISSSKRLRILFAVVPLLASGLVFAEEQIRSAAERAEDLIREIQAHDELPTSIKEDMAEVVGLLRQSQFEGQKVIDELHKSVDEFKEREASLMRVQTTLTSGLIGALVTALIAIIGAVAKIRDSKAERDLKRLDVIEKSRALLQAGVTLPADIRSRYFQGGPMQNE